MTDNELAEELEFHAKHGISAAPALQHEASERIYALSAHVALLKASLAQAEREAEKATASAEPFGYFRVTPFGWEDCAETGDGAIPLYTAPQPDRVAELERELETERMRLAACGTAALGYYDWCADEYRSASLDDVLRLRVEAERLRTLLSEAAEDIQYWGAYASDYLQEKHDLSGCAGKYRAAALSGKEAQS